MMMEQMNNFKYKMDNINQINDNNKTTNEKKNDIIKNLTLNFVLNGKDINIQCQSNEKMQSIIKKFAAKVDIKEDSYCFIFNAKNLIDSLTIEENGLTDKDKIFVCEKIEIMIDNKKNETQMKNIPEIPLSNSVVVLIFSFVGRIISIQVSKNNRFSEAFEKFLMKASINIENKEDFSCLYNSRLLESNDNRTIEEIFKEGNNIRIDVIKHSGVIGA